MVHSSSEDQSRLKTWHGKKKDMNNVQEIELKDHGIGLDGCRRREEIGVLTSDMG